MNVALPVPARDFPAGTVRRDGFLPLGVLQHVSAAFSPLTSLSLSVLHKDFAFLDASSLAPSDHVILQPFFFLFSFFFFFFFFFLLKIKILEQNYFWIWITADELVV